METLAGAHAGSSPLAFADVVGQRQADTVADCILGQRALRVKDDGPVTCIVETGKQLSIGLDQPGLTVHEKRRLRRRR